MKTSSIILFLTAAAIVTAPLLHADVVNRVTLSGSIVTVGEPVTRTTGTSTATITKLVTQKINNATVLDAMVQSSALSNKTGYGIVEIFTDAGVSQGFFALNTRTGDSVPIAASLLSGFTDSNLITAESSSSRTGPGGAVAETASSSFTGVASSTIANTPSSVFLIGQTAGRNFTNRVAGDVVKIPYTSTTYTALIRGVSADHEVVNAKLISTGSAYRISAP
jgi:hypothetical protein